MGMENFKKTKNLEIGMRSWKSVREGLAEMERLVPFWDQTESLFCGSWEQDIIYLCDYLGLSGTVWDMGSGMKEKAKRTPQELIEPALFMRGMSLEPSLEQIRETRKGEGKDWQLCRVGLLFKWSDCIKTSFLK